MDMITLSGFLAAACSVTSFVPQAWKIVRTRDTSSLSPPMYALTTAGFLLFTIYGIAQGQWPLILTNAICFALASFILAMTLLSGRAKRQVADAIEPEGD
jgi:MtN3 and saliva related transmembrane protein